MLCEKFFKENSDWFYLAFRVLVGFMLMVHGASKFGFGSFFGAKDMSVAGFAGFAGIPVWLGFLVAFGEFAGGLGIMLGVFTRFAAASTIVIMTGAFFMAHFGLPWITAELPMMYIASALLLLAHGNGAKCSVEHKVLKKEVF